MTMQNPFPRWAIVTLAALLPVLIIGGVILASRSGQQSPEAKRQRLLRQFRRAPTPFKAEYLTLVDLSREVRDYKTAITVLKSAAAEQPKNAFIFELLADLYVEDGNFAAAESAYRRAILDDVSFVTSYVKLADLLWDYFPKRRTEIEALLLAGIRASNHLNIHKRLARYYTQVGSKEKALASWSFILKQEPDNEAAKEEIKALR